MPTTFTSTNSPYAVAVFIGRFHPFHNGHLFALKKALEVAEDVVIGIGNSAVSGTKDDPLTVEQRRVLLQTVIDQEHIGDRVLGIVEFPDMSTDIAWAEMVQKQTASILHDHHIPQTNIVSVSNNEWTNTALGLVGFASITTGLYNRDELEGKIIRQLMREGNTAWKTRVPKYLVQGIEAMVPTIIHTVS